MTRDGSARLTRRAASARAAAALTVLACLGVGLWQSPGHAADAAPSESEGAAGADLGMEVTVGYSGNVTNSAWLPVEVALEPLRPVAGTLEVAVRGDGTGTVRYTREIEVAATSRSVYRFVVPQGAVTARLTEPGRQPVAIRLRRVVPGNAFLVGLLGTLPPTPPPLRSEATGRTGTWVAVDPGWLSYPEALDPLGTLVAPLSALDELPADALRSVAAALVAGTDLVVVADRDGVVDLPALGLPAGPAVTATPAAAAGSQGPLRGLATGGEAWTLTAADVVDGGDAALVVAAASQAGRGRLTVVGAEPGSAGLGSASALWSAVTGPSPEVIATEWDLVRSPWQFPRVLADEDAAAPTVPWLASFLLAYIVVVGPVNGLVLGRLRRRELAWVTVPVVTAVFTAAAFLGAVGARPPVGVSARLAYWVDGVGTETAVVGVRNPTPGVREASLPGSWLLRPIGSTERGATVRAGEDTSATLDLAALQLGAVVGSRPLSDSPPMEVTATAGPDGAEVAVRNTSQAPLEDVALRMAGRSRPLGTLAPGATQTVTFDDAGLRALNPYRDVLEGIGAVGPGGGAAPPRSLEALLRSDLLDGNPGLVWAVASTPGNDLGATAAGRAAVDEGTLFAVGVRPGLPEGGEVSPFAVHRAYVSATHEGVYAPSPLATEGGGEAVLRFRFPAGGRLDRLQEDLSRGQGEPAQMSVWDVGARQWVPVGQAFAGGGADPARFLSPLGEVYVQASGINSTFDFSARSVSGLPGDQGVQR